MPHEISDNQRRLMDEMRKQSPNKPSTRDLGNVKDANKMAITPDIGRKVLDRLERRGLVAGTGKGLARQWGLTDAGEEAMNGALGPKADWTRPYVVLEKITLEELLQRNNNDFPFSAAVWVEVLTVPARNTEHAYKLAADHYEGDHDTTMVAVSTRNFQPQPVEITNTRNVTVGRS